MLGCLLIAFNLCAPPGYYGSSYAYAQSGYYVQQPQVVYVQPAPVYYAAPVVAYPGPFGYSPGISVAVGPRGGVRIGVR